MQLKKCGNCNEENPVAKKECKCGYIFKKKAVHGFQETPVVLTPERLRNVGRPVRSKPKAQQNDFVYGNCRTKEKQTKETKEKVVNNKTVVINKKPHIESKKTVKKVVPEKLYPKRQRSTIHKFKFYEKNKTDSKPKLKNKVVKNYDENNPANKINENIEIKEEFLSSEANIDRSLKSSLSDNKSNFQLDNCENLNKFDSASDSAGDNLHNNLDEVKDQIDINEPKISDNCINSTDVKDRNDNTFNTKINVSHSPKNEKNMNQQVKSETISTDLVKNQCSETFNIKNVMDENGEDGDTENEKAFVSFQNISDSKVSKDLSVSPRIKSPVMINEEINVLFIKSPVVTVEKLPMEMATLNKNKASSQTNSTNELVKVNIPECVKTFLPAARTKRNGYLKSLSKNNTPATLIAPKRKYRKKDPNAPPKIKRPVGRPRIHFKQNLPKRPVGRPRKLPQTLDIKPTHKLINKGEIIIQPKQERFSKIAAAQSVMECVEEDSISVTDTTDSEIEYRKKQSITLNYKTPNKGFDRRRCFLSPPSLIASAKKDRIRNEMLDLVEQKKLAKRLEKVKPLVIPEDKKEVFGLILEEINRRIISQSFVIN